jgi:hypothetical protein
MAGRSRRRWTSRLYVCGHIEYSGCFTNFETVQRWVYERDESESCSCRTGAEHSSSVGLKHLKRVWC